MNADIMTLASVAETNRLRAELLDTERQIARLREQMDALNRRNQKITGNRDGWKREALKHRERLALVDPEAGSRYCGCYVLLKDGVPLYVGQSINVFGRAASHRSLNSFPTKGQHDEVRIVWCDAVQLDAVELKLITELQPPLNRAGTTAVYIPRQIHKRKGVKLGAGAPA